ncbi:MAG: TonB-dependent receptor plug domain-containing protein [Flavobacteriaceae bacterium]
MNNKGIIYLFIFLFFLNLTSVIAQTVQEDQQPLANILKELETRYNISFSYADDTIKDKQIYSPKPELDLDEVLGYLNESTDLEFELLDNRFVVIKTSKTQDEFNNQIEELPEIFITNYLTTGITKTNNGSINIKPESFGILPGLIEPDILQTVQALPGILSVDETVSNINVRGGTHDQNLILLDGIKMYQSGHFFGLISAYSPYLTKEVNIYKNGTSAQYGDGVSSTIGMQLSNAIDGNFNAGLGFNLINVDLQI